MATGSAIHISRERFHLAWDPAIPAIETVRSGDEVEFDLPNFIVTAHCPLSIFE
jgi:acetamidase/formamidase